MCGGGSSYSGGGGMQSFSSGNSCQVPDNSAYPTSVATSRRAGNAPLRYTCGVEYCFGNPACCPDCCSPCSYHPCPRPTSYGPPINCPCLPPTYCPLPENCGSSNGSTWGSSNGSTCGSSNGSTWGSSNGSNCGSSNGATCGSSNGSTWGSSNGSTCGSSNGSTCGSSNGSTCGSSNGSTCGSSNGSSCGSSPPPTLFTPCSMPCCPTPMIVRYDQPPKCCGPQHRNFCPQLCSPPKPLCCPPFRGGFC